MMGVVIVVLVVIGALFAIVSGVWVAIALISAISVKPQRLPPQDGAVGHGAEPSERTPQGGKPAMPNK